METMVNKYVQGYPQHRGTDEKPKAQAVLVTGTTGALGSHLLEHLVGLPEVSTVYAFNRHASTNIRERHRISLSRNAIDPQLLDSPKLKLLEGDLSALQFGLTPEEFEALRANVTFILHNGLEILPSTCTVLTIISVAGKLQHLVLFYGVIGRGNSTAD